MDKRRRQYVPISVMLPFSKTGTKLKQRFGRDGLLIWTFYLIACKTNWVQGQMSYTSEVDGWQKLGLYGYEPEVTLNEFFTYTGQIKQTRRTRSGHVTDVICTRWEEWNNEFKRDRDAEEKSSKRATNTATKQRHSDDDAATLGTTEVEVDEENEVDVDAEAGLPATSGVRPRLTAVRPQWQKPSEEEMQRVREMIPASLRKGA